MKYLQKKQDILSRTRKGAKGPGDLCYARTETECRVATMCKLMEDMRSEAAHDKVKEKAILMLKNGKISFDEVSVFFSELSDEEIEEIKSKIMHLV